MPDLPYSFSYAVLRYVTDARRDASIPVGVALWSEGANWARTRFLPPGESLATITREDRMFINLVSRKIEAWMKTGQLPYDEEHMSPTSDRWWRHLQEVLIHKVRISEPRPIDCREPEADLDTLFQSVVGTQVVNSAATVTYELGSCNLGQFEPASGVFTEGYWKNIGGNEIWMNKGHGSPKSYSYVSVIKGSAMLPLDWPNTEHCETWMNKGHGSQKSCSYASVINGLAMLPLDWPNTEYSETWINKVYESPSLNSGVYMLTGPSTLPLEPAWLGEFLPAELSFKQESSVVLAVPKQQPVRDYKVVGQA
jgi:hypothetical protein